MEGVRQRREEGSRGQTWDMLRRLSLQDIVPGGLRSEGGVGRGDDSQVSGLGSAWRAASPRGWDRRERSWSQRKGGIYSDPVPGSP